MKLLFAPDLQPKWSCNICRSLTISKYIYSIYTLSTLLNKCYHVLTSCHTPLFFKKNNNICNNTIVYWSDFLPVINPQNQMQVRFLQRYNMHTAFFSTFETGSGRRQHKKRNKQNSNPLSRLRHEICKTIKPLSHSSGN